MTTITLCTLDELPDAGARGFTYEQDGFTTELFAVRQGGEVHVYRNRCPHTGVTLEWIPDQFLDYEKTHIQCSTHGALFRISDGFCVFGPCAGASLEALPVKVIDNMIKVILPPAEESFSNL